jgi:hypothetical protein
MYRPKPPRDASTPDVRVKRFRFALLAGLLITSPLVPRSVAAQVDVIRGTILGPDSTPIQHATVKATSVSRRVSRTARTGKDGRYTISFPGTEGNYLLKISALGFASKQFEIKRIGDEKVLVADARLALAATKLEAVEVNDRGRVGRGDTTLNVSGAATLVDANAVAADQIGNLASLAASLPGVQFIPGTAGGANAFSVLGLGGDLNAAILNGLYFAGTNIPRDARVTMSLLTTPYDVSRGGFAGGLLSLQSQPADNYTVRSSSLNFDSPYLQWYDRTRRALREEYQNISAGGLIAGPIQLDRLFYSVSYQAGRRWQDYRTLLTVGANGLTTAGIAPDSVARVLSVLDALGAPSSGSGLPSIHATDNALLLATLDYIPGASNQGNAFNLTINASLDREKPVQPSLYAFPSQAARQTSSFGLVQARHSGYFRFLLSETSIGLSQTHASGRPLVAMPSGTVRVSSVLDDSTQSVQTLSFGGNPAVNTAQTTGTVQARNQLSWFSTDNLHTLQLTTELRHESYGISTRSNDLGSFVFNSLTDLEANSPAQFTRQLSARQRHAGAWFASAALGDAFRPTSSLHLQYGVRVDANRFENGPALNQSVRNAFDVRNDRLPNEVALSPRAGFTWTPGQPEEASLAGAATIPTSPRWAIRGGVGMFTSLPSLQSIGLALDNTGLPTGVQQVLCVGAAVPVPAWSEYEINASSVPISCADGTLGTPFASSAPNVYLFSRAFRPPRAIRSNLQWSGTLFDNRMSASVDATYSLNLNQSSTFDLNFAPTAHLTLPAEAGRAVFADEASIVPSSGAFTSTASRELNEFAHVAELRSDMRSRTGQLSINLSPSGFNSSRSWSLAYVYANARERFRGFTSAAGNPLEVSWSRSGFDSRHQFVYTLSYNLFDVLRIGWYGSLRSGSPYTPVVVGDVNGDGYANDRAFVFSPAVTGDGTIAAGMSALLAQAPRNARECLTRQMGAVAGRNSCEGPWTSTANLTLSVNPLRVRMSQRATVALQIANPLGAADLLLHGESRVRGWGQPFVPRTDLLLVRGFDPLTHQFRYDVNPRFGSNALSQRTIAAPVILTLLMKLDMAQPRERQELTQTLDFGRARGTRKVPAVMLKSAYGTGGILNPLAHLLKQADTLGLTRAQADSLAIMNRGYLKVLDSVWIPTVKYLSELPDDYDRATAYRRYREARETSVDALIKLVPFVKGLLTPEQRRHMPSFIAPFLDTRYLASVRSSTAGAGLSSVIVPPPAGAMPRIGGGL